MGGHGWGWEAAKARAWPTVTSSYCSLLYALDRASCVMSLLAYMSTSAPLCRCPRKAASHLLLADKAIYFTGLGLVLCP